MTGGALRHLPNVISVARIVLILPTAWSLWLHQYVTAVSLLALAGASDALDGWVARRYGWVSAFGAMVDPVADKLLVGALFIILALQEHLPLWLVAIALGRDLIIVAGVGAYRWLLGPITVAPTLISKANTAAQIALLLLVLLGLCGFAYVSPPALAVADPYLVWLVAGLGIASGADYVVTWSRRALAERRSRASATRG